MANRRIRKVLEELIVKGRHRLSNRDRELRQAIQSYSEIGPERAVPIVDNLKKLKHYAIQYYENNPNPDEQYELEQLISVLASNMPGNSSDLIPMKKTSPKEGLYIEIMTELTEIMTETEWDRGIFDAFEAFSGLMENMWGFYDTEEKLSEFLDKIKERRSIDMLFEKDYTHGKRIERYLKSVIPETSSYFRSSSINYRRLDAGCAVLRALSKLKPVLGEQDITELAVSMPALMNRCKQQQTYVQFLEILIDKAVAEKGSAGIALRMIRALPDYMDSANDIRLIRKVISENALEKAYGILKDYMRLDK